MAKSTRELLLSILDDIEFVAKELLENIVARKISSEQHEHFARLLIAKDRQLEQALLAARRQARVQARIEGLRAEVERQDRDVARLQRQLKEAEQILATAVYQAKQKLRSIARADHRPVPSEELVKYAHRISASNAVCAPLAWQQGDPRRPYPTDIEMRLGYLGRFSDLPSNGQQQQQILPSSHPSAAAGLSSSDLHGGTTTVPESPAAVASSQTTTANRFAWHPSGEIHASSSSSSSAAGQAGASVVAAAINAPHKQETEDVEVMSTDSSSSSSSDSQ